MKSQIYYLSFEADKNDNPILRIATRTDRIGIFDFHEMPLTTAFDIVRCNQFLRELFPQFEIKFESFSQYAKLIEECCLSLDETENG